MRKLLLIASVAVIGLPSIAAAQESCHERQHNNRVAGTAIGAGLGALLGSSIAGHGSRGVGAVAGAVGGGAVGNVVAGSATHCERYSAAYYDRNGVRHDANGYYDRGGVWHYYGAGYYDRNGYWVDVAPAAEGYGADVAYTGNDLFLRENRLEERIRDGDNSGAISRYDADRDYRQLTYIRSYQRDHMHGDGYLSADVRADLSERLDNLSATVESQWRD